MCNDYPCWWTLGFIKNKQKCARNKVHISNKEDNSSLENIYVE